ncbi:hypothetical protein CHUAL_005068 [Chamberlinius hualienensis]
MGNFISVVVENKLSRDFKLLLLKGCSFRRTFIWRVEFWDVFNAIASNWMKYTRSSRWMNEMEAKLGVAAVEFLEFGHVLSVIVC